MQDWMGCGSVNGFTEAFNSFDLYTEWKSCDGHDVKDVDETFAGGRVRQPSGDPTGALRQEPLGKDTREAFRLI